MAWNIGATQNDGWDIGASQSDEVVAGGNTPTADLQGPLVGPLGGPLMFGIFSMHNPLAVLFKDFIGVKK